MAEFAKTRTDGPNQTAANKTVTYNDGAAVMNFTSQDEMFEGVPSRVMNNAQLDVPELEVAKTNDYLVASVESELSEMAQTGRQQLVVQVQDDVQAKEIQSLANRAGAGFTQGEGVAKLTPGVAPTQDSVDDSMKVAEALAQGYSQEDVTSYLTNKGYTETQVAKLVGQSAKVVQAREAGYDDEAIRSYLVESQTQVANIETQSLDKDDSPEWSGSYWPVPTSTNKARPYANETNTYPGYYGAVPKKGAYDALVSDSEMTAEELYSRLNVLAPSMANMTTRAMGFLGNQEAAAKAEVGAQAGRERIIKLFAERGLEVQWDAQAGEFITPEGQPITEDTWESIKAEKFEIIGGVSGGVAGFELGSRLGLKGAIIGSAFGAAAGAAAGTQLDYLVQATALQADLEAEVMFHKAFTAAETSLLFDLGILGTGKVLKHTLNGMRRVKDFIIDGNTEGAKRALKEIEFLTDSQIDETVNQLSRLTEVPGKNAELQGIAATAITKPGAEGIVKAAASVDPRASGAVSQAIDERAKDLLASTKELSGENFGRLIKEDLSNYVADVKNFYTSVKSEAAQSPRAANFRFDYDKLAIEPVLASLQKNITDPDVLNKFILQAQRVRDMNDARTFGDLLELRQIVNEFKFNRKITNTKDFEALNSVLKRVDDTINSGAQFVLEEPNRWLKDYATARKDYAKMKQVERNVMYQAMTSQGVREQDVAESLSRYITALDGTYNDLVTKLPKQMRERVEASTIDTLANRYTAGMEGGQRATNFPMLADELNKVTFTTKDARRMKAAVNELAEVFRNDIPLSRITGAVQIPSFQSYLTVDPVARAQYEIASQSFNYMKTLIPNKEQESLALVRHTAKLLENPMSSKSVKQLMEESADKVDVRDSILKLQQEVARATASGKDIGSAKVKLYGDGKVLSLSKGGAEHSVPLHRIATTQQAREVAERAGVHWEDTVVLEQMLKREGYVAVQQGTDKVRLLR